MDTIFTFRDALVKAIRTTCKYNHDDLVAPSAILWPDEERQWERVIPFLRNELSILTLGIYSPKDRIGPAYYLRCMVARTLEEDKIPESETPIIYLPGISKQAIRAIKECPSELQPLAELQYRGALWVQKNGRDWTVPAFIQATYGGLAIEISSDQTTKAALQRSLLKLLDEPLEKLKKAAPLRSAFFDALLASDEHKNILEWLEKPDEYPMKVSKEEWQAFCNICKAKYQFDPERDGPISAVQRLSLGENEWSLVWARYKEAPNNYPGLPDLLRRAGPQQTSFEKSEYWPQENEDAEQQLLQELTNLDNTDDIASQNRLIELEKTNGIRREWVWSRLGETPLANSLEHLSKLSNLVKIPLTEDTIEKLINSYFNWGWEADAQFILAIQKVTKQAHSEAVRKAARTIYEPWLRNSAEKFQHLVSLGNYSHQYLDFPEEGTCILFIDSLRMDIGQKLAKELCTLGYNAIVEPFLAALPTITATAKPAILDFRNYLTGERGKKLYPQLKSKNNPLTAQDYRDLLSNNGFQILGDGDLGDPLGYAWTEIGAIDNYGHEHGWRMVYQINNEIDIIAERVQLLLDYGWIKVIIVTDHGWLLLPGSMTKDPLPEHLTAMRKGRCAELLADANIDHLKVPWYWDSNVMVAISPGINCFEAGKEYEHGGVSLQECVTPKIIVTKRNDFRRISISDINWRGLRFSAILDNANPRMFVDIRLRAGDINSSIVTSKSSPDDTGFVSLLVSDEDKIGKQAFIVVESSDGILLLQADTVIGG